MKRLSQSIHEERRGLGGWRACLASGWATRSTVLVVAIGLVLGLTFLVSPALAAKFSDVYSDSYDNPDYPDAVNTLSDLGAIGGFPDGTFRPHDPVTRQQFAKMIVKLMGITVTGNEICPFVDVLSGTSATDPFYPDKYVAVCASVGIAKGIDATHFAPYNNITRAQVLSMVVRAAKQAGVALQDPNEAYYSGRITNSTFRTLQDPIHGLNVQIAEMNNLIWGIWPDKGSSWDVYGKATRGEVAQIMYRLWQKMGAGGTTTTQPTTTTTQRPTTTTTTPSKILLFSDNFSNPNSGWPVGVSSTGISESEYENGVYWIQCQTGYFTKRQPYTAYAIADGVVKADMTLLAGGGDASCSVIFRVTDAGYYDFTIDGDGYCSLWRYESASNHFTALVEPATYPGVLGIGRTNHVEIQMSGGNFIVHVNGYLICTGMDSTYSSGNVGFSVDPKDSPVKASFDNLEVWTDYYIL